MEVIEHLSKQNEKILEEINNLKTMVIEIKTDLGWLKEMSKDMGEGVARHHDRLSKLEHHSQINQSVWKWAASNLFSICGFLVASAAMLHTWMMNT